MLSIMLSDDKYYETKNILLQKIKPTSLISELAVWFFQEYHAKLLNIDFVKFNPRGLDLKYSLLLIIENRTGKINNTELALEPRINIKDKFIELSTKHNFADIQNLGDIERVSVCVFSEVSQSVIIAKTLGEATVFLKNKYPDILRLQQWQNTIAVIYYSDAQVIENKKRGINEMIMNDYFGIIKNFDDVNCFTKPSAGIFVSQETLKRSYMNELHYYMR